MGTPGENNPLWSSGQGYQYPQCNRQTTNAWPVEEPHCSYRTYPAQSSVETGMNPSSGLEAPNCVVYQQPLEYGHSPSAPSANIPIEEGGPFAPAEVPVTNQHMSPDGGYSSSASVGSEYFAPFPQQPQAYAMSPYQNMVPSVEAGIKFEELEVKQEQQEPFRNDEVPGTYSPQMDYFIQTAAEDNKPIIHENVLIRAPDLHSFAQQDVQNQIQAQMQMQTMQLNMHQQQQQLLHQQQQIQHHQQQQHQLHQQQIFRQQQAQLYAQQNNQQHSQQQIEQKAQEAQQESQQKQPRKVRKQTHQTVVVIDDQQPSTSTAPIPVVYVPDESPQPAQEIESPARPAPRNSRSSPADMDPNNRRSARPSVVEISNFPCDICGEFFARQCGLTQHKKWIHSVRKLPCERCGKKFPTPADLDKHIARHDMEDKPFKCDMCPKQFCHKNDLKRHRYRHDDTAPFVCTLCDKSFIRQDHLVAHLLSHERRQQALENGKVQEQQEKLEKQGKEQQQ